jgi:hypothetical protein
VKQLAVFARASLANRTERQYSQQWKWRGAGSPRWVFLAASACNGGMLFQRAVLFAFVPRK